MPANPHKEFSKAQRRSIIDGPLWRHLQASNTSNRLIRALLKGASKYVSLPLSTVVALDAGEYPAYTYCVYHAAQLARRLHIDSISVIEFGVAGGNGLLFLERIAAQVEEELGLKVQVFGFDSGEGLPEVTLREDLPYWFQKSQYRIDVPALKAKLQSAKLIVGDVKKTVADFFTSYKPPPVGAILNDLDLYSSTADSLKLFDHDPRFFLPRVFLYFDDVVGSELEMYGSGNGQLRAIDEFNQRQKSVYLGCNRNLLPRPDVSYRYQIYYAHLIAHPQYATFVGQQEQAALESLLRLKAR
jgi:hypothetical protein